MARMPVHPAALPAGFKRANPQAFAALLGALAAPRPQSAPGRLGAPPQAGPLSPAPYVAAPGHYQGAPGSESEHPGMIRDPMADWNNPSSPNYERRNFYIDPSNGLYVAREPGYYNPDNPFDTGRPGEKQGEYRGMSIGPYEGRMSEPGVAAWGPGGHPGAGPQQAPAAAPQGINQAFVRAPQRPAFAGPLLAPALQIGADRGAQQDPQQLLAALVGAVPKRSSLSYGARNLLPPPPEQRGPGKSHSGGGRSGKRGRRGGLPSGPRGGYIPPTRHLSPAEIQRMAEHAHQMSLTAKRSVPHGA